MTNKSVPDRLTALGEIYRERNAVYGNSFEQFGELFIVLFPNGLTIKTKNDANRTALIFHVMDKIIRYATNFENGGHADSCDDACVYLQILQMMDAKNE